MERMKKFFLYFIMFIALVAVVTILTNLAMREHYKNIIKHEIKVSSPKITIEESKATDYHGYIKGKIINDTGKHIKDKYLRFDFYDNEDIYLGTEFKEIKYFNINETINFEINYEYFNVDNIKINFVDEVDKSQPSLNAFGDIDDETLRIALPISAILCLYTILP